MDTTKQISQSRATEETHSPRPLPPGTDLADERMLVDAIGGTASDSEPASAVTASRQDRIRIAAYWRFIERGGQDGSDLDDWLAAEAAVDAASERER